MDGCREEVILRRLEQLLGKKVTLASTFQSFELDSLDAVELSINLEDFFGIRIREVNFIDPYGDYTVKRLVDDLCRNAS